MDRIYHNLSDDTLKELYVAVKRAKIELLIKAPRKDLLIWYQSHKYGSAQLAIETGVWAEMDDRKLLCNCDEVKP